MTILEEMKDLAKKQRAAIEQSLPSAKEIVGRAKPTAGVALVVEKFDGAPVEAMRAWADAVQAQQEPMVAFLASVADGKCQLVCAVSGPLREKGWSARDLIGPVAKVVGGGGGGKNDVAQAGGKDASKLEEAFALARKSVEEKASKG
jgi:alanyl-tRNA synthetase